MKKYINIRITNFLLLFLIYLAISCNSVVEVETFNDKNDKEESIINSKVEILSTYSSFDNVISNGSLYNLRNSSGRVSLLRKQDKKNLQELTAGNPPVAYWDFDDSQQLSGDSILDAFENITGTFISNDSGVDKILSNSLIGNSLTFNGIGDYIEVPNNSYINFTSDQFTVMTWIYVEENGYADDYGILCLGPTDWNNNPYILTLDDQNVISFRINNGLGLNYLEGGTAYEKTWMHIVGTYDGATMRLFQNGMEINNSPLTGNILDNLIDNFNIGKRCGSDNRYFKGAMDEIGLFDRALTSNEIGYIYSEQKQRFNISVESKFTSPIFLNNGVTKLKPIFPIPYGFNLFTKVDESLYYENGISNLGLITYLAFDEISIGDNSVVKDLVLTNGNDGIYHNPGLEDHASDGIMNGCIYFDGIDDYLEIPDSPSLNISSALTLSAWVKLETDGQQYTSRIISKGQTDNINSDDFALRVTSDNGISCRLYNGTTEVTLEYSRSLELDVWNHLACTYDGSLVKGYINGKLAGKVPFSGLIEQSGFPLILGSHGNSPLHRRFNGYLDEVSIWSRALTVEEVNSLYLRQMVNIKFRVRFCNFSDCRDNQQFTGPNQIQNSFYKFDFNTDENNLVFDLLDHDIGKDYFQYEAIFESKDNTETPELIDIELDN